MSNKMSSDSQEQNNIESPKQKRGKTWTKEDMEKAKPYPLPEVPAKEKMKKR